MRKTIAQHQIPGTKLEVQVQSIYYGPKHGHKYSTRVLEIRDRPVKDDWRQLGSEIVFATEQEAREKANAIWSERRAAV